ncbi:MFS transporter [Enterococcus faecium]|uniref:hypothetical protein n=1 Tax=Enterococcus faecium TaxID=1352 RepID=UPI001D178207|nr:hypothetical protein [Enterococcus faecium]MCC4054088.1 hypothetical protein [Enterococcus faecium]
MIVIKNNFLSILIACLGGIVLHKIIRYFYFVVSFISTIGSEATALVVPLILYSKTDDVNLLMMGYSFQMIPVVLLGSIFHSILQKYNNLTIYAITDFIQAVFLIIIWFQLQSDNFSSILIVILLIISSVFATIHNIVGDYFVLPYITTASNLAFTNGLYSQIISYAGILAPILVGIFAIRNTDILIFDAITFIPSVLFVYFVVRKNYFSNYKDTETISRDNKWSSKGLFQLYDVAFTFYKENKNIFLYTLIGIVINFSMSNFYPLMVVTMKENLSLNQIDISVTLVLINALGLFALPLMKRIQKSVKLTKYILFLSVIGAFCLFIQTNIAFIFGCSIINIGVIIFNSVSIYARQVKIPENIKYIVVIVHKTLISIPYILVPTFLPKITTISTIYSYIYVGVGFLIASFLLMKIQVVESA